MKNMITENIQLHHSTNKFLTSKNIRLMTEQELCNEIHANIKILDNISKNNNFYQIKLTLGASALRESLVNHIGFKIQIPSTNFCDLYECFTWTFDIEGNSDTSKLQNFAFEQNLKNISSDNVENQFLEPRIFSLLSLSSEMKTVFNVIDEQLNYYSDEQALLITALAFYEMELLSSQRNENYLIFHHMYNTSNLNDKWIACMNVQANYIKSTIINMPNYIH